MNYLNAILFCLLMPLCSIIASPQMGIDRLLQPYQEKETLELEDQSTQQTEEEKASPLTDQKSKITKEDVLDSLHKAGKASIGKEDTLEIKIKTDWKSVSVPLDSEWSLDVVEAFAPDNRGRWFPSVILKVDGRVQDRWRLNCEVELYRMVYMTTQRLGRGETPMRPGIHPVICNIYDESTRPVPVSEDLGHYEMVRTLAVGQFLTWEDISPRPAVRKGETVDVILEKGRLSISMLAMCLQDGLIEETVLLKNTRTRVEFTGVVTALGIVKVSN
jgi:flagella basal body P-ring formation protein FlgA